MLRNAKRPNARKSLRSEARLEIKPAERRAAKFCLKLLPCPLLPVRRVWDEALRLPLYGFVDSLEGSQNADIVHADIYIILHRLLPINFAPLN